MMMCMCAVVGVRGGGDDSGHCRVCVLQWEEGGGGDDDDDDDGGCACVLQWVVVVVVVTEATQGQRTQEPTTQLTLRRRGKDRTQAMSKNPKRARIGSLWALD